MVGRPPEIAAPSIESGPPTPGAAAVTEKRSSWVASVVIVRANLNCEVPGKLIAV
jgi:hypothetical protein